MIRIARRLGAFGVAATLALALQGCGGGSSSSNVGNNGQCNLPSGVSVGLVYPATNTTGNSTAPNVVIATNNPLPASWNVVLIPSFGSAVFNATIQPTSPPFPSPNQAPPFSNPIFYVSSYVSQFALPAGSSISVQLNDTSSNCAPGVFIGGFGT